MVGSLCINLDITNLVRLQSELKELSEPSPAETSQREVFTSNVDELLDSMISEAVSQTGKTVSELDKDEKVAIVHSLDKKGAFLIKKAAERIADSLGISRFTVYNYLNECHSEH